MSNAGTHVMEMCVSSTPDTLCGLRTDLVKAHPCQLADVLLKPREGQSDDDNRVELMSSRTVSTINICFIKSHGSLILQSDTAQEHTESSDDVFTHDDWAGLYRG